MTALLITTVLAAVVALGLGVAGVRRVGRVPLAAEVLMLVAMADVHVPALGIVSAPFWALLLGGCALGTALVDRVRRSGRPGGDHLHALGMLLGAAFVLLGGVGVHGGSGHGHGVVVLVLPVGVAAVVHAGVVLRDVLGRRLPALESVRRLASLVSVLAMGAMVVVH